MSKIENSKILPQIYYGLHMVEGVAEYKDAPDQEGTRIFIGEQTIKNMDPSFQGRPVYVDHVEQVDLSQIQSEADGYVVRSFFNKPDGKHWAEFLVVSDKGHSAIKSGWKLSNAYIMKATSGGGQWHAVDYQKEVTAGEYEHLAIVQNPRYEESIILTPEQFKEYNLKKENELKKLTNSNELKQGEKGMLSFFTTKKVENSADIESMSVTLPKSKKVVSITKLVNEADEMQMNMEKPMMANGDHKVKIGEEEMSVNELVEKYNAMCDEKKANAEPDEEALKKAKEDSEKKKLESAKTEESKEEKTVLDDDAKKEEKKMNAKKNAEALAKLESEALKNSFQSVELSTDKVARGKSRYGSN